MLPCSAICSSSAFQPSPKRPAAPSPTLMVILYNAVQIGSQCWMKENLHVTHFPDGEMIASFAELTAQTAAGPFYYSPVGKPDAYVYGHWYNWKAVMHGEESSRGKVQGICPDGWHVPSATEWQQLADYVASQKQFQCSGVPNHIASALAAKKAWLEKPACKCGVGKGSGSTDATGFSAMPRGYFMNQTYNVNRGAYFWTSTSRGYQYAQYFGLYRQPDLLQGDMNKEVALSVRCLRDEPSAGYAVEAAPADDADRPIVDVYPRSELKTPAQFPGGPEALSRFLMENTQYPASARDAGIQGIVIVQFVIGKDGSVVDVFVLHGVCKELDAEALRVAKLMPKWEPAISTEGLPDACIFRLPFRFFIY